MGKRIAVVGAGAVGGYIGAHLARAGERVTLIDAWPQHVEAIRARGLEISGMTEEEGFAVPVEALHLTEVERLSREDPVDIAIVSVKSYDTAWATALIAPYLAEHGFVVSAQNCINEERIAAVVGWGRTVGCMIGNNYAVELYEPGRVRRASPRDLSVASIQVGEVHGRVTPRLEELHRIMQAVDGAAITNNLWGLRWSKLCVNVMRNGVSAATGLGGNARDAHDVIRPIVIRLGGECVKTGKSLGYALEAIAGIAPELLLGALEGDAAAYAKVEEITLATTTGGQRSNLQRPSMAQDMAKGRRTEIDFMNGFVVDKARSLGLAVPTNEALVRIVKRVERRELTPKPENLYDL
jgi:2-dehydropantoate 2-reductase